MSSETTKYITKNRRKNLYGRDPEIMKQQHSWISTTENIDEAHRFDSYKEAADHLATLNEFWQDALILPAPEKHTGKKSRNAGWDPNSNAVPFCDDCGVECERGYSMQWKGDRVETVWCFDCRDKRDMAEWEKTRRITSHFMTKTIIKQVRAIYRRTERRRNARTLPVGDKGHRRGISIRLPHERPRRDIQKVEDAVRHFRQTVWPIVHAQVNAKRKFKGMRIDRDGLTVLTFAMCGRIRIRVERGESWCSVQGTEESAEYGIGLHGMDATAKEAVQLWRDAIALFKDGGKLVADRGVGIL